MKHAGLGVVFGVALAGMLSRVLSGMLYGVSATDPVTFVLLSAIGLSVAAVAAFLPGESGKNLAMPPEI